MHATLFRFLDAIHLPFSLEFSFKLSNCAQHIEEQASGGRAGIKILVDDMEMDFFAL